jgi:hypothetical protein
MDSPPFIDDVPIETFKFIEEFPLKKIDSQRGLPLGRPWVKGISGISHIGHD